MNVGDFLIERLCAPGASAASTATRATASTGSWARSTRAESDASSSRCATRRWPPSWPAPREVHRRGRRLPGHFRPRRDPPAERPLRREARPPARRGDRRPAGACPRSAATTSRRSISLSLFKDVAHEYVHMASSPGAAAPPRRPGAADRARRAHGDVPHRPQRRPGRWTRSSSRRTRTGRSTRASAIRAPACVPHDEELDRAAERPQCRRARRDARRRRARSAPPTRSSSIAQSCSAPASRRRCWARRSCRTTCRSSPGSIGLLGTQPSYELMMGCDTLLMVGSSFPYAEFLPEEGAGARRADRPRRAHDRHPLPDGRPPRRRRRGDAARARAAARAEDGPLVAGEDRARGRRLVAAARASAPGRGRPRQSPARLLRSSRRGCPTTASSPPTPAPRRAGSRAT